MKLMVPIGPRDHTSGRGDAAITLVEYGDYECAQCAMAYPIVKNIRRHYGDKLTFVFRNFPQTQIHPHAEAAAEVAEAAASQGTFWEMHDTLFEHQPTLGARDLLGFANKLGLDVPRIRAELEQHVYRPRIEEDRESGARSGVCATPTFFVNDVLFEGQWYGHDLIDALENRMKRHAQSRPG
jgi:protein-disulfide isomerase